MTTYNKSTLKTFFETGDVPQGSDYANFIDSYINMVDTGEQSMASPLTVPQVNTPLVSAAIINVTNTLSAVAAYFNTMTVNSFTINTAFALTSDLSVSGNVSITGGVSAARINVTGDVSAATGTVYASAVRVGAGGEFRLPAIVSAAGTTQATGASLGTNGIVRLKGISDGQTTGFRLLANLTGLQQTLWVEENTSCNLWPPTGGQINALSSNAAFGMSGNTQYIVTHIKASGYSVK